MAGLPPSETLVPFADLDPCAANCGRLYDANGACVPPAVPVTTEETYKNCFCDHAAVQGFKTGLTGVCAANVCQDSGLESIQHWFAGFCGVAEVNADGSSGQSGSDNTNNNNGEAVANGPTATASPKASSSSGGGDWLSTHWKWIVMLAILIVGIVGIWVGACIWRRHYVKKRERSHALGKHAVGRNTESWGPGAAPPTHASGPTPFMSPANGASHTEKHKKKWVPKERT